MIVEQRIYDIMPGKIPLYMKMYHEEGIRVQQKHLGCLLGYYYSEFGDLNQVVHLWRYDDFEDRAARRRSMLSDTEWSDFFERISKLIERQRSTILTSSELVVPQPAELKF